MLLPSVVHVSSTFEFGSMFHDCLSSDPQVQSSILPLFFFFGGPSMLLLNAIHEYSTFEFGAMFQDCLSADPQVQSSLLPFFFRSSRNVIAYRYSCVLHLRVWSYV